MSFRSIRTRMLVLMLVMALLPLLMADFLASYYGRSFLGEVIGSNLRMVAQAVMNSLDNHIDERRAELQAITTVPVLQKSAGRGAMDFGAARRAGEAAADSLWAATSWEANPVASQPASDALRRLREPMEDFLEIFVTDGDGWVVAATNKTTDYYQADETWWQAAAAGGCGAFHIDDIAYDASASDYVTAISVPICDASQEFIGVLKAGLGFRQLPALVTGLDAEQNARIYLISRHGAVMATLEDGWQFHEENSQPRTVEAVADTIGDSPMGYLEASIQNADSVVGFASSSGSGRFRGLGWKALAVEPMARAYRPIFAFKKTIRALLVLVVLAVVGFAIHASVKLTAPILRSSHVARRIAAGNLSCRLLPTGQDEMDLLAESINDMTASLGGIVTSIRSESGGVDAVAQLLVTGSRQVAEGSRDQIERVAQATQRLAEADASLDVISSSVQQMVSATGESYTSLAEMEVKSAEIVSSAEALGRAAEGTLGAVNEMVASIQHVDGAVENLHSLAKGTVEAVVHMDEAVEGIEQIALTTTTKAEEQAADAETGRLAMERTIASMAEIAQASEKTSKAIRQLIEQSERVGSILGIIDSVTKQTELLALNATILAAQAGERGSGFAVVADEIKGLAQRTASATHEISDLVGAMQSGAAAATEANQASTPHIKEGVARSTEAGEALEKIQAGIVVASDMVRTIAQAVTEHSGRSHQISAAMQQLHETVASISATTQEQTVGCEAIVATSARMREMTRAVLAAVVDQEEGSRRITGSMGRMQSIAGDIDEAAGRQKLLSQDVVHSMSLIHSASGANVAAIAEVDAAVSTLTVRAENLRRQLGIFGRDDIDDGPGPANPERAAPRAAVIS